MIYFVEPRSWITGIICFDLGTKDKQLEGRGEFVIEIKRLITYRFGKEGVGDLVDFWNDFVGEAMGKISEFSE